MIEIEYTQRGNWITLVRSKGHAETNICAAVTAIMRGAANAIGKQTNQFIGLDPVMYEVNNETSTVEIWYGGDVLAGHLLISTIYYMLEPIAEHYPESVRLVPVDYDKEKK